MTAALTSATRNHIQGAVSGSSSVKLGSRRTGRKPLRMSMSSTGTPALGPNTRKVLVAPALRLPCSRTSIPKKALPHHTLVGMLPTR